MIPGTQHAAPGVFRGIAAVLAFAWGRIVEGIAIAVVLVINGLIGFVSEWRARRSMEALQKMGRYRTRVRRAGEEQEIWGEEVVPGDICLLTGGEMCPADLRLVEGEDLRVNEALRFLGVAGLVDPAHDGVRGAIEECRAAGIRIVMVTGDRPDTARAIGRKVGIVDDEEEGERRPALDEEDALALHGSELGDVAALSDDDCARHHEGRGLRAREPRAEAQPCQALPGGRRDRGHDRRRGQRHPGPQEGEHRRRHGPARRCRCERSRSST